MASVNWEKYGFEEDGEYKGVYNRPDVPMMLMEDNGNLTIWDTEMDYILSEDTIPATNRQIELLLKFFCVEI